MFNIKKKHSIPGLNTTSTADISFMLLIFFLVTTSMATYKGLSRQMPPADNEKAELLHDIDKENILTIQVTADNKVTLNDVEVKSDNDMRKDIRHFIIERGKQHIIELNVSRDAKYDTYFHLQNQIVLAYREIRNAASKKKYGMEFLKCTEEQKETIMKMYPQRMTEKVLKTED